MPTVRATTTVPGRVVDAEELWYDPHRWAAWIDGFGHVAKLEGDWPHAGARLLWDSRPQGRGRVSERVTEYEARAGQTLAVEDARLDGTQQVAFEPQGDEVLVNLTLEYTLKQRSVITPLLDLVFIRRALRDSLQRTLERFGHERRADVTRS
ncbi:MAG TPA: SRPBCC family protein [Solirubrobacteraceae bacterium]